MYMIYSSVNTFLCRLYDDKIAPQRKHSSSTCCGKVECLQKAIESLLLLLLLPPSYLDWRKQKSSKHQASPHFAACKFQNKQKINFC